MRTLSVACLILACLSFTNAEETVVPLLTIPRLSSSPSMDGKLSYDQWNKAAKVPFLVVVPGTEMPSQATEVYVYYTDHALYFGFDCREARMDRVQSKWKKHDESVWGDDCVEVLIQPDRSRDRYFHFAASIIGTQYDATNDSTRTARADWNAPWKAVTSKSGDRWQCEFEIPFSSLETTAPRSGDTWYANICREQKPMSENSAWSPVTDSFHDMARFGLLVFGDDSIILLHQNSFSCSANGAFERSGRLTNPTQRPVEVTIDTRVLGGRKPRLFSRSIPLESRGFQSFHLVDEVTDEGHLTASLAASVNGRVFYRVLRPFEVPPVRSRIRDLTVRLVRLEDVVGKLQGDAAPVLASLVRSVRVRRDSLDKMALYIPEMTDQQVYALLSQAEELERALRVAEVRVETGGTGAFLVWAASPWVQLRPGDLPAPNASKTLRTFAYRGEKIYAAVNVTNFTESALDLMVSCGPFVSDDGNEVAADRVEVRTCAFVKEDSKTNSLIGDALPLADQAHRLMVPPSQTGQAFIIIGTKDLPAGRYSGKVSIAPTTGGESQSVDVLFTVYPVELPRDPQPKLSTWGGILNVPWAKPDPHAYLLDAVEHGVNVFLVNPHNVRPELDKEGNIAKPPDYASHDKLVKAYKPHGMILGAYSIGIAYDEWAQQAGIEYMSAAYRKGFISWVRDWIAHLKSLGLGYQDFAFELVDEPAAERKFRLHTDFGRLMREADPKARVVVTANLRDTGRLKQISDVVDIWVPHVRVLEDDAARQVMVDSGKEMWTYICSGDSKRLDPTNYYRFLAWEAFRYDLAGWGYFAHMWWGEKPWESNNTMNKHLATYSTVYPGATGPVTSRRYEAYWKGHEDYRALRLLERLVSGSQQTSANDSLLKAGQALLAEGRNAPVTLKQMMEEGASPAERAAYLDDLRARIAQVTVQLLEPGRNTGGR